MTKPTKPSKAPNSKKLHALEKLMVDDAEYETTFSPKFMLRKKHVLSDPHRVQAFLPGQILKVYVEAGQNVERNAPLLLLEAMKMENDVRAQLSGRVKAVHVVQGQQVARGDLLLELE